MKKKNPRILESGSDLKSTQWPSDRMGPFRPFEQAKTACLGWNAGGGCGEGHQGGITELGWTWS